MPEWWRSHAPGSCAFIVHGVSWSRLRARARASITRWRIDAESSVCVAARSARVGGMDVDADVHSIQQWPGQTREIPASVDRRTGAPTPTVSTSARAGIGCHHQLECGGIPCLNAGAMHMDDARFKGFAQGIEDGGSEFGGLVEKENPSVRQRRRPGDERARAATDQRRHGHRVVRGLERRPRHQ